MSELLKGLRSSLANIKQKKHKVCINGKIVNVDLKKKKEVIQNGEDAYYWISDTEFRLKPPPKPKVQFSVLKNVDKGYSFHNGDIHWPDRIIENGEVWQIESE